MKKDKERLQIVNADLKQFAPRGYDPEHLEEDALNGSFMDMKQKNVIEVLDLKCRQLKKKNDMLLHENENLRTELKLLCAADKDFHDDFIDCKIKLIT